MAVTRFGRAVREARRKTQDTLKTMSESTGKSVAFLSAIETGRTTIPLEFVKEIIVFFDKKGYTFTEDLKNLAIAENKTVPLDELTHQHRMMVAGFANSRFSQDELDKISNLLKEIQSSDRGES